MGAVAGGATIWCTHFVGMLAYRPGVETTYAPVMTGVSLLVAMLGCAVALRLGAARFRHAPEVGGAVFGAAVAAMHYTGMAAFTAEAFVTWSPAYVVASVLAAVVGGALALRLAADKRLKRPIAWSSLTRGRTDGDQQFTGMGAQGGLPVAGSESVWHGRYAGALVEDGDGGQGRGRGTGRVGPDRRLLRPAPGQPGRPRTRVTPPRTPPDRAGLPSCPGGASGREAGDSRGWGGWLRRPGGGPAGGAGGGPGASVPAGGWGRR